MSRDYMSGLKELILQLYDCPAYLDTNTNNRGIVVVRDTALSILGAATPAALAGALTVNDWYNGNLARFALLTPEPDYHERLPQSEPASPADLVYRLRALHERLPAPPAPKALGETDVKSEMSAEYITSYIRGRLQPARARLIMDGLWAGPSVPPGYIVDTRKALPDGSRNPNWRKYTPYEPFVEV
jgi:hypothetical protein